MKFTKTPIKDAYIINLDMIADDRGFFARLFCQKEFKEKKLINKFVQINNSFTKKRGTIRGMHYQKKPKEEVKVVRCVSGKIFDATALHKDGRRGGSLTHLGGSR